MAAFEDPRESGFDPELVKTALMSREQFTSKPRKLIAGEGYPHLPLQTE